MQGAGTPTCAGGVGRELDFFIIDARLAEQVIKVEPVLSLRKEPHSPVRVVLKATRANLLTKVVKRPGMFPITKPIGCCRMPVVPPQHEWSGMVQQINTGELVDEGEKKDVVNRLWTLVPACMEAELCGCCDAVDSEGLSAGKFMGRATGVAYKQAQVWPKRASGKLGTTDLVNHGLAWMASRLSELHQLTLSARRAAQNNEAWRLASERQWSNLVARFKPSSALLRAVMTKVPEAEDCLRVVGALDPRQRESPEILAHWAQWADTTARERKRQGLSSRRDGWGKWVELQLKKGAGALFKHAKREEVNQGASVTKDGVKTGAPQDVVDAEREEWINTWHKFVDIAQAPWRTESIDAAPLPRPTIEEARHCIASFKPYTAVGVCSTRPRWYGWLSDALISAWIDFFVVIEEVGRWPDDIQDILIHLIPKPSSGTRPIGVLPSPLRWWEKLRKATIWRWRAQNERDYNWSTRGRSAEAAVYGQALRDEAALARRHFVAATLFDLTKAYETVRLELVWEAGKKFGFPLRVLRIALEGFAFARHLIFNRAVAQPVLTLSAILAGAGAAQDALLLVLMGLVDELVAMSQAMASFILYVDDLGAHTRGGSEQAVADQSCRVADLTIQILEEGLGLTLSRGREGFASSEAKTVGVGSGRGLRTMLLKRLGKKGDPREERSQTPGSGLWAGKQARREGGADKASASSEAAIHTNKEAGELWRSADLPRRTNARHEVWRHRARSKHGNTSGSSAHGSRSVWQEPWKVVHSQATDLRVRPRRRLDRPSGNGVGMRCLGKEASSARHGYGVAEGKRGDVSNTSPAREGKRTRGGFPLCTVEAGLVTTITIHRHGSAWPYVRLKEHRPKDHQGVGQRRMV